MKKLFSQLISSSEGFTLIEVMIALVILVIGVLGVFSMQLLTIKGNTNAISLSRSVQETSAALDRAESLSYNDAELSAASDQDMNTLFGAAQNFSGTITYDVVESNNLVGTYGLKHDTFPGSSCKIVTFDSTQRRSGDLKTITLQYVKVDY